MAAKRMSQRKINYRRCFRFPIFDFHFELGALQTWLGRKSKPNFILFAPCESRVRMGSMSSLNFTSSAWDQSSYIILIWLGRLADHNMGVNKRKRGHQQSLKYLLTYVWRP